MRTLVTGGAGFIGTELVASLVRDGVEVTVVDDLSTAADGWRDRIPQAGGLAFVRGDAADVSLMRAVLPGHRRVVHLAASTDVAGGFGGPELDFRGCVAMTEALCEAASASGIEELWLASSGVVYGRVVPTPSPEDAGPLLPESHYAAGKLAAEAIVSGFAHLGGWRALVFRFGNTIGGGSDHGLVHDLVVKLLRDPRRLEALGDGSQAKPYLHVTDLVAGMRFAADHAPPAPVTTLNLGHAGTLSVRRVAELVIEALGLAPDSVALRFTGTAPGGGGWRGDTPHVEFDVGRMRRLGWNPRMTADESVRSAAREIAARYRRGQAPLVTSIERNAARRGHAGASDDRSVA